MLVTPLPKAGYFPPAPKTPWHISWVAYCYLRYEVDRLKRELYAMTVDRDHWYGRANYTPEELREMYLRRSTGLDKDGNYIWPDGERTRA